MKKQRWIKGLTGALLVGVLSGCNEPANHAANHIANAAGYTLNVIGGDVPPSAHNRTQGATAAVPTIQSSIHVDENTHSVQLRLSAATNVTTVQGNAAHHTATLSVPLGWSVYVTLSNTAFPHSAMIVQYNHGLDANQMNKWVIGKGATGTNQSFLFKARTPGEYAVVCATPGHNDGVLGLIRVVPDRERPLLTT